MEKKYISVISRELKIDPDIIKAVEELMNDGATIPFIARYRKEQTNNLDEVAIQNIFSSISKINDLISRKKTVIQQIESLEKMTPQLLKKIEDVEDIETLEDIYLPFKPKRKNKASEGRNLGMEPFALKLLNQEIYEVDFSKFDGETDKNKTLF